MKQKGVTLPGYEMESIIINGGKHLKGTINISGSKCFVAYTGVINLVNKLQHYPYLADINSMLNLLNSLGVNYKFTDKSTKNKFYLNQKLKFPLLLIMI